MTAVPPLRIDVDGGADDVLVDDVDGDDRLVGADAARELLGQLVGLLGGRDAVGGAEILGRFALVGQRVDGDQVHRAGVGRALDRVGADAADAVDDHGLAGHHVGGVDRGAPAGRDAAADEHDDVERQVLVDHHARRLGDRRVLRERAEHAHPADVLALAVEAERAVGQAALEDRRAEVADVRMPRRAPAAVPADGQERGDDVVALGHARDARADLLDHARALVAADDREARDDVAVAQVLVGVAEARRLPADQDLALFGLVEIELHDLPVATRIPQHRCLGLHEALLL